MNQSPRWRIGLSQDIGLEQNFLASTQSSSQIHESQRSPARFHSYQYQDYSLPSCSQTQTSNPSGHGYQPQHIIHSHCPPFQEQRPLVPRRRLIQASASRLHPIPQQPIIHDGTPIQPAFFHSTQALPQKAAGVPIMKARLQQGQLANPREQEDKELQHPNAEGLQSPQGPHVPESQAMHYAHSRHGGNRPMQNQNTGSQGFAGPCASPSVHPDAAPNIDLSQ